MIHSLSHRSIVAVLVVGFVLLSSCASGRFPDGGMGGMHGMHEVTSEYRFLVEMIPHHQEAVDTSRAVTARTVRPELREFADKIARDQEREIEMMRGWLAEWYPGKSTKAGYRPMMRPTAGLSPDRADRAWLEDMIMHHRMAVMMADSVLRGGFSSRPETMELARTIVEAQNREIEVMEKWLAEWYGVTAGGMHRMH